MTVKKFEDLPDDILQKVISYLPQQSKVDLLYTNYRFYTLAQPLLYQHLAFSRTTLLKSSTDFQNSNFTIIGTATNPLVSIKSNQLIYETRQEVLLQSFTFNPELLSFVESVLVVGNGESDTDCIIPDLLNVLKTKCVNLRKFEALNTSDTIKLSLNDYKNFKKLERFDLYNLNDLNYLQPSFKELAVHTLHNQEFKLNKPKEELLNSVYNLTSITFNNESATIGFLNLLLEELKPTEKLHLKSLKIFHYHGFNDYNLVCRDLNEKLVSFIDYTALKHLEIFLGCDNMACDCLHDFFTKHLLTKPLNLSKLAIVQHTEHRDHNYSEKFDFCVTNFLDELPNKTSLNYLSIRHTPPEDFNIGNGFEGNYIKRREMYSVILPKLSNLRTLVAPHFLETLACYEQLMSDLIWNGCTCDHCSQYFSIFDSYLMAHQYYDGLVGHTTDVTAPMLFGPAGFKLSQRLVKDHDLDSLSKYPLLTQFWDFHTSEFVDISHGGLAVKKDEVCEFNESCFAPLCTCISHFLKEYVVPISEMVGGELERVCLSGVVFWRVKDGGKDTWKCVYE